MPNIEEKIKVKMVWVACILIALIVCSFGKPSISENNNYCEMVKIHIDSNGENGWPDYNNNYKELCNE